MIDRRSALAGIVAMFGAAIYAPIARAATGQLLQVPGVKPGGPIFTPVQRATVTALSERVMPTTDTPGAIAAGVPEFIEMLLGDWSLPEDRIGIVTGLDALEARARKDYGTGAAQAKPEQQDALLTLAMQDKVPGGAKFFDQFRQAVIAGYFTSEIGITQEREYLPVPGSYDGAYPYSKVNKVFSG